MAESCICCQQREGLTLLSALEAMLDVGLILHAVSLVHFHVLGTLLLGGSKAQSFPS